MQSSQQSYTYDAFGNRILTTRGTNAVGCVGGCEAPSDVFVQSNHLKAAAYDEAGNVVSVSGAAYDYDGTGMVTRATVGSDVRMFIYNADDERIGVRNGLSWTWTVRDLSAKVLREFTSTETQSSPLVLSQHTWSKDYIWRDGLLLASVFPLTPRTISPTTTYHYHLDHLGTPRMITDNDGVLVAKHTYYPFGAEMDITPHENAVELMKFTGHERDVVAANNASVDYMHARYYNANLGRFLSVDPTWDSADLGHPQAWNRYSYVRNNPIGNTDPDGKFCIPCAVGGALVAVSYESYRQVRSGEAVNNKRLFAAIGIGAVAGATLGAAAEFAPIAYNAALANPAAVASGTAAIAGASVPGVESITGAEISAINRSVGGTTEMLGHVDTVIANMAYRETAVEKAATAIRDIAVSHLFDNGNKRTAQAVAEKLLKDSGIGGSQIRSAIDVAVKHSLQEISDIAKLLQ